MSKKDYVYTASGHSCESTYGTYEEAYTDLVNSNDWGVVLKHEPYGFVDAVPKEEVMYEHLPELK